MFIQAKKKREELRLPILHYIVADDWMDKLGPKAFTAWLKFHTWVNRQDEEMNDISKAKIPMSIEKVAEKLDMNKSTLYRTIIPVLWEYGLIDLVEFEDSKRKTQKPVNIIPYDYPQNNKELETKPLHKCRDWKKDYNTKAAYFGRQGGRPTAENIETEPNSYRCENATVDRCENATVDRCENATVTVAKVQPNNYSNNSTNVSNNSINHDSNTLLMDEEEKLPEETKLYQYLLDKKIDSLVTKAIVELAKKNDLHLYGYEIDDQLKQMYFDMNVEGKKIIDFPVYFLNGIVMQRQQRITKKQNRDLKRIEKKISKSRRIQLKAVQGDYGSRQSVYYNWLED